MAMVVPACRYYHFFVIPCQVNQLGSFDDILLGINVDDFGSRKGRAAYFLNDCPAEIDDAARS